LVDSFEWERVMSW